MEYTINHWCWIKISHTYFTVKNLPTGSKCFLRVSKSSRNNLISILELNYGHNVLRGQSITCNLILMIIFIMNLIIVHRWMSFTLISSRLLIVLLIISLFKSFWSFPVFESHFYLDIVYTSQWENTGLRFTVSSPSPVIHPLECLNENISPFFLFLYLSMKSSIVLIKVQSILIFADDMKLFSVISSLSGCISLLSDLNSLVSWFNRVIDLSLNVDKYRIMSNYGIK